MGLLFLIRHGESQYNLENRFTGGEDPPLTERGRFEMTAAGDQIRGTALDLAFCSAMSRSLMSVQILLDAAHQPQIPVVVAKDLNERNYGSLQGMNKDEAVRRYGEEQVRQWRRSYRAVPPGGESLEHASERILPFFRQRILLEAEQWNVLVCAHGNTLRAIVRDLECLQEEVLMTLDIPTASILLYRIERDGEANLVSKRIPVENDPGGSLL